MNKVLGHVFFFIFLISLPCKYFAQTNPGARQISLAHSDVALSNDVFALFGNPAGLSQINSSEFGIFYSPSPFNLTELSNGFLAYTQPTTFGNLSIGAMAYGFDLYKENRILIGYSNQISKNMLIGITTFYHSLSIKRYGSESQFNFSLGGLFFLDNNFSLGFALHNPLRYSENTFKLSSSYRMGITYKPIKKTSLNFALSKDIDYPFSFHFGVEYPLVKFLNIRIGIQNEPNLYNGGIGLNYSFFSLNYAVSSHQELGLTHQFDLIIGLN
jgi:hypothetical protein